MMTRPATRRRRRRNPRYPIFLEPRPTPAANRFYWLLHYTRPGRPCASPGGRRASTVLVRPQTDENVPRRPKIVAAKSARPLRHNPLIKQRGTFSQYTPGPHQQPRRRRRLAGTSRASRQHIFQNQRSSSLLVFSWARSGYSLASGASSWRAALLRRSRVQHLKRPTRSPTMGETAKTPRAERAPVYGRPRHGTNNSTCPRP
mmetsp:Transcript_9192/g.24732  ORF Transcript_9192/g.24732 Transcript_9192/m.24732 type:complete len:202 (-) Transcript_9192:93-698(-)